MKRIFFVALTLILLVGLSCRKDMDRRMEEGQIAVTFDDASVDNWFSYLPLLDSLNIKATFYVCRYHQLTAAQKHKLHKIEQEGHEIAYHTTSHPDLVKLLQKSGMEQVINQEVQQDLTLMRRDGFDVKNFAYPYGSHNSQLDGALKRYFKTMRMLTNKTNWNKSLVKRSGDLQLLYGAGVDQNSRVPESVMASLLDEARINHDCVVFTAHEINTSFPLHVSVERLKWLAEEAEKRNLKFITIDQIQ